MINKAYSNIKSISIAFKNLSLYIKLIILRLSIFLSYQHLLAPWLASRSAISLPLKPWWLLHFCNVILQGNIENESTMSIRMSLLLLLALPSIALNITSIDYLESVTILKLWEKLFFTQIAIAWNIAVSSALLFVRGSTKGSATSANRSFVKSFLFSN